MVEELALGRGLNHANANAEVSKSLALVSLTRVALEKRLHDAEDLLFLDGAAEELVKALSVVATTKVHVVGTVRLSDKGDLGKPRTGTAVGTARHAHDDAVLTKTVLFKYTFELADELGQVALRLCHGETTSGESNTCTTAQAHCAEVGVVQFVLGKHLLHLGQLLVRNVGQDKVLVTCEAELTLVDLGDFEQAGLHREVSSVLNTTVFDEHGEVVLSGLILLPAKGVDIADEVERTGLLKLLTPVLFHLGLEDVNAHVVNGVLHAGVFAVLTVTVITLNQHDLLAGNVNLLLGDVTKDATSTRVGLLVIVSGTHTTTGKQVETNKVTILALDGNKTNVMSIDISVIVRRNGNGDFELAGQVSRSVQGFVVLNSITGNLCLVVVLVLEPNLVISCRGWQEMVAD